MGLGFIDPDDLFEEINFEGAEKIEDWEFITYFPSKPTKKDDYPSGNEYVIYARCDNTFFSLYFESQAQDFKEALVDFNKVMQDFKSAKKSIVTISKRYSANFKQLCLV